MQHLYDSTKKLLIGTGGVTINNFVNKLQDANQVNLPTSTEDLQNISQIIVNIVIGICTIIAMFRKAKNQPTPKV